MQELIDAYATAGGSSFTVEMASAFSDFLGHAAEDITLLEIEAWRENRKKATNNKYATINKHVSALKAILNFTVDRELIDRNSIAKIKKLKMDAPDGEYAGQIKVPAMFRFENTVTVGASNEEDERSEEAGSNYGSSGKWEDVFAPGGHIL